MSGDPWTGLIWAVNGLLVIVYYAVDHALAIALVVAVALFVAHLIADDIISSCNNIVAGFLKGPKDKDLVLSALARSEKGFRDEEWRRFVDDMPIGMAIGRFPYTTKREMQRPFLFRPLMLDVPEPSDEEIEQTLGRIAL